MASTTHETSGEDRAKAKRRKYYYFIIIIGAIGGALSLLFRGSGDNSHSSLDGMFSNAPISSTIAIILALAWFSMLPAIIYFRRKVVDEHDHQLYQFGALWGWLTAVTGIPVWWVLARGGFVPPVEPMLVFVTMLIAHSFGYLYKKHFG